MLLQLKNYSSEILEKISFSINRRKDLNRYELKCYWAIASENAFEPYYVSFVHPKTLGILDLEEGEDLFNTLNSIWFAPIGNLKLKKQLSSMRNFFDISYQYEGFMALYLFPLTLLNSTFGYSYGLHHFFPSAKSEK